MYMCVCVCIYMCVYVCVWIVSEVDRQPNGDLGLLGIQIRKKRFEGYNMAWLREAGVAFGVAGVGEESLAHGGGGNIYGAHGIISHMLDDGDSIVSMGAAIHDFGDSKVCQFFVYTVYLCLSVFC